MCGIAGIIAKPDCSHEFRHIMTGGVDKMLSALRHRGPDGEGKWAGRNVALGMRRLSIIDPQGGWQPLFNEQRSLVLVANGEIYNYVELRDELEKRGHQFRTGSDCETIVHLYEEYGEHCVDHLRGMFSFALWDIDNERLLLARDRMGEKPLYMAELPEGIVFASEIRALLASGLIAKRLDFDSVHRYIFYQFVPEPQSPVSGVRKLPAAHIFSLKTCRWEIMQTRYWAMEDAPPLEGQPEELIRSQLEDVSRLIVRADVPVGIALSGGLDSSAIAVLTEKEYPGTLQAFSVGYPGRPDTDERHLAQSLAGQLGMPFHEIELDTGRMVDSFAELVASRDEPIADISGFGYFEVMRAARDQGVAVMLQGQGGDELFWGYDWLRRAAWASRVKDRLYSGDPLVLAELFSSEARHSSLARKPRHWLIESARFARDVLEDLRRLVNSPERQLVFYDLTPDWALAESVIGEVFTSKLLRHGSGTMGNPASLFQINRPWQMVDVTLTRLICETYLLCNGVNQGDRLGMASSVELRLPLLDYRLVETVIGLRKAATDSHLPGKTWLKNAMVGLLPDEIINRPKRGFTPPVREWHDALFRRYGGLLIDGYLVNNGVLSRKGAMAMSKGPYPIGAIAPMSFKTLVLELWCREVLEGA